MLINTLLIVLKHLLPLSFISMFYFVYNRQISVFYYTLKFIAFAVLVLLLQTMLIQQIQQNINEQWLELIRIGLYILFYLIACYLLVFCLRTSSQQGSRQHNNHKTKQLWLYLVAILSLIYFSDIQLYFAGVSAQIDVLLPFSLGLLLGSGISLSILILGYFVLRSHYMKQHFYLVNLLFLSFCVGQLSRIINNLVQIDYLQSQQILFNSNFLLPENSELGYFLIAFVGYEATPTIWHVILYTLAFILPLIGYCYQQQKRHNDVSWRLPS